jgi:hypothetical protein
MKETRIFQIQIGNEEQLATKNIVRGTKTRKETHNEKLFQIIGRRFDWNDIK